MTTTQRIPLSQIEADPNQPRIDFEPIGMKRLYESVASKGILAPLILEKMKNGHYLIVDGERRFRTATKLGLKDVPGVVMEPMSEIERIVARFNIQEQQQSWSSYEKALAIATLQKSTNWSVKEMAEALGLSVHTITGYNDLLVLSRRAHETARAHRISFSWMLKVARASKLVSPKLRTPLQEALSDRIAKNEIVSDTEMGRYVVAVRVGGDNVAKKIIKDRGYTYKKALKDAHADYILRWRTLFTNMSGVNGVCKEFIKLRKEKKSIQQPEGVKTRIIEVSNNLRNLIAELE